MPLLCDVDPSGRANANDYGFYDSVLGQLNWLQQNGDAVSSSLGSFYSSVSMGAKSLVSATAACLGALL